MAFALAVAIGIVVPWYKIHLLSWVSVFLNTLLATRVVVTSQVLCVLESMCIRGQTDVYI